MRMAGGRFRLVLCRGVIVLGFCVLVCGLVPVGCPGVLVLGVVRVGRLDLLDVDVQIREEIVLEVVAHHVAPGHELVLEPADVPDDQRHGPAGRNPQRVG